jgi:hypothetical protein
MNTLVAYVSDKPYMRQTAAYIAEKTGADETLQIKEGASPARPYQGYDRIMLGIAADTLGTYEDPLRRMTGSSLNGCAVYLFVIYTGSSDDKILRRLNRELADAGARVPASMSLKKGWCRKIKTRDIDLGIRSWIGTDNR